MPDLFYTNPESLASLLQDIDEAKLVLPAFQRGFDWDVKRQDALLRSVVNGYPAGSLLFLEQPSEEEKLGKRLITGVEKSKYNVHPTRIILDGQQRLTTLYHILYDKGGSWTRRALIDIEGAESFFDSNGHLPQSGTGEGQKMVKSSLICMYKGIFQKEYDFLESQFDMQVLPLTCIFGKEKAFVKTGVEQNITVDEWKFRFAEHLEPKSANKRLEIMKKIDEIKKSFVKPIEQYRFPVILLTRNTERHSVCQVFVDLNIQQKPLRPFEVVAAKVWPFRIDLYGKWEKSLQTRPYLREFHTGHAIDRVLVLQAISLIQTHERSQTNPSVSIRCTRPALYEIQPDDFEGTWDNVVDSVNWCLGLLKGEAGVLIPKWLPFSALLVSMSATVVVSRKKNLSQITMKHKLLRWFWCSVFANTYASATNTQNAWDFQQLLDWIEGGSSPYTVDAFSSLFSSSVLRTVSSPASGQYKGVICLLLRQQAKDFYTKQRINTGLILKEKIEDHHIFPASYLERLGVDRTTRNCVLNRSLIDAYTNKNIGADSPSTYLNRIRRKKGEKWLAEVLQSQLLPTRRDSGLCKGDFESFLDEREKLVAKAISEVTI